VIESYDLNFGIDDSQIDTKGSADLRDLDHITFTVDPDINALPLEKVAPILGINTLPLNGPMSLKGQLHGRTGGSKEMLASLDGHLNAEIGPGRLNKIGKAGDLFGKILSMTSIQGLFAGKMFEDLSGKGLSFQTIKAQTSFAKGTMNLNNLHFGSAAMNVDSQGTIDLVNQKLNIKALLVPLATVDKAFNLIPIVGKAAANLTKIRINVKGPLEDPKIHAAEAKQVGEVVEDTLEAPVNILKDAADIVKDFIKTIK
jgi:uncharacterized protein YhdP